MCMCLWVLLVLRLAVHVWYANSGCHATSGLLRATASLVRVSKIMLWILVQPHLKECQLILAFNFSYTQSRGITHGWNLDLLFKEVEETEPEVKHEGDEAEMVFGLKQQYLLLDNPFFQTLHFQSEEVSG